MIDALAADFRSVNPPPLGGGARNLVPTGEKIFQNGVPESNVAACAACHGPDAQGSGEIPRLAGQLSDYVFNKLVNWSKERGQNPTEPDISAVMSPVAHSLTRAQVEAVAAYLSYLPPGLMFQRSSLKQFVAVPAFAGHTESSAIRNCTWCHGGSAQGYTPAPRLAGQRSTYIEQQLLSFANHTRDAPFSRQYM